MVATRVFVMAEKKYSDFGNRLNSALLTAGYRSLHGFMGEYQEQIKVSERSLRSWTYESGPKPQKAIAYQLAEILGCNPVWLYSGAAKIGDRIQNSSKKDGIASEAAESTQPFFLNYFDRGEAYYGLGMFAEAAGEFRRAASLAQAGSFSHVKALVRIAVACLRLDQPKEAHEILSTALRFAEDSRSKALVLVSLANFSFREGRFDEAGNYNDEAFALATESDFIEVLRQTYEIKGVIHQIYERWDEALEAYEDSQSYAIGATEQSRLIILVNQGICLIQLDSYEKGRLVLLEVLSLTQSPSLNSFRAYAHWGLGLAAERVLDWQTSYSQYQTSRQIDDTAKAVTGVAKAMKVLDNPGAGLLAELALTKLVEEGTDPTQDNTPEWVWLAETLGPRALERAKDWFITMTTMVPQDYWNTTERRKLLQLFTQAEEPC